MAITWSGHTTEAPFPTNIRGNNNHYVTVSSNSNSIDRDASIETYRALFTISSTQGGAGLAFTNTHTAKSSYSATFFASLNRGRVVVIPGNEYLPNVTLSVRVERINYHDDGSITFTLIDSGTSPSFSIGTQPTVTPPSATLRGVNNVLVNGSLFPSISLSGGDYDSVTHSWSAVGGTIAGTTSSANFRAASTYTNSASITWTGVFKKTGASDVTVTRTARFSVTAQPVILPAVSLTGVEDINTGDSFSASVSIAGGSYETFGGSWRVSPSAAGTLRPTSTSATFTAGNSAYSEVRLTWTGRFSRPGANTRTVTRSGIFQISKPSYTVNGPSSIETGQFGTFTVTSSEPLDGATVVWTRDPDIGVISPTGTACTITPDDISVVEGIASERAFTVTATINQSGEQFSASATSKVVPAPPNVVLPTVAIQNIDGVEQGQTISPTLTISGGTYDEVEHNWVVIPSDKGTFDDPKSATPIFTAANLTTEQTACIEARPRFKGTGTNAYNNTYKDTATHCNRFSITANTAVAPSLTLDGVRSILQGEQIGVAVELDGGIYDPAEITYQWRVFSTEEPSIAIGTFGSPTARVTTIRGAATSRTINATISCTVSVSRRFQGATTTASATVSQNFRLLHERLDPQLDRVQIRGDRAISVGGTTKLSVQVSGDSLYDGLEYSWIVEPNNGTFDDATAAEPTFTAITPGNPTITCRLIVLGTGSNARIGRTSLGENNVTHDLRIFTLEEVDTLVTGSWREIPQPGVLYKLDPATLPIIAEGRQSDEAWKFGTEIVDRALNDGSLRTFWNDRTAGNRDIVPDPSFIGQRIKDMKFIQNRLVFLTNDTVVASIAGLPGSFWGISASGTIPADPIDLNIGNTITAESVVPQGSNLWILTENSQHALYPANDSGGWSPGSMRLDKIADIPILLNHRVWSDGQIITVGHPNQLILDLALGTREIAPFDISARCPNLLNWPRLGKKDKDEGKIDWSETQSEVLGRCLVSSVQTQIILQRAKTKEQDSQIYPTRLLICRQVGETFCWSQFNYEYYDKESKRWSYDYEIISMTPHEEEIYLFIKDKDGNTHLESLHLGDQTSDDTCVDHKGSADEKTFPAKLQFNAPVFFQTAFDQIESSRRTELTPARFTNFNIKDYTIHFVPQLDREDQAFEFSVLSQPYGRPPVNQIINNRQLGYSQERFLNQPLPQFDSYKVSCNYDSKYFNISVISDSSIPFSVISGEWNASVTGPEERRRRAG